MDRRGRRGSSGFDRRRGRPGCRMPLHREDMSRSARRIIVRGNGRCLSFIVSATVWRVTMRIGLAAFALLLAGVPAVFTQTPSPSPAQGPTYDVVSIKRNQASIAGRFENPVVIQRP